MCTFPTCTTRTASCTLAHMTMKQLWAGSGEGRWNNDSVSVTLAVSCGMDGYVAGTLLKRRGRDT